MLLLLLAAASTVDGYRTGHELYPQCSKTQCLDYVAGVMDANFLWAKMANTHSFCVPKPVNLGQINTVFIRYMNRHPSQRKLSGANILVLALEDAYPCPEPKRRR